MARSLDFKIYDSDGIYQASCRHATDAAAVVAIQGDGATVRFRHRKRIWTEGENADGYAGDSYDEAAELMLSRMEGGK